MPIYPPKVKNERTFQPQSVRLMDQVSKVLRYYHYGLKTEKPYVYWIKDFISYHQKRHPKDMAKAEIKTYLGLPQKVLSKVLFKLEVRL